MSIQFDAFLTLPCVGLSYEHNSPSHRGASCCLEEGRQTIVRWSELYQHPDSGITICMGGNASKDAQTATINKLLWELNTPLEVARNLLYLIRESGPTGAEHDRYVLIAEDKLREMFEIMKRYHS